MKSGLDAMPLFLLDDLLKCSFFQVFVKGRRDDFMAHPEEALHWGSEVFPSENDFQMMAKSYLRSGLLT